MKDLIKKELDRLAESQVYGQEGISKKVAELTAQRDRMIAQRNMLTRDIKNLDKEIQKWEKEISPNQISMF
jgi:predicted  nucleic acid-binding Zn-ribbon protein